MKDLVLSVQNISVAFEGRTLFDNLSFELPYGSKCCLKGPSGSGKSTILNAVMGFMKLDSGSIYFHGKKLDQHNVKRLRKSMCWLPQNLSVLGNGNVFESMMLLFSFAANKHLAPTKKQIIEAFDALALAEKILDADFETISGGEKQRVGLALCKLLKRDLILLDEPTSALDKESVDKASAFILGDPALTVLSTSHDSRWADMCDKVIEIG